MKQLPVCSVRFTLRLTPSYDRGDANAMLTFIDVSVAHSKACLVTQRHWLEFVGTVDTRSLVWSQSPFSVVADRCYVDSLEFLLVSFLPFLPWKWSYADLVFVRRYMESLFLLFSLRWTKWVPSQDWLYANFTWFWSTCRLTLYITCVWVHVSWSIFYSGAWQCLMCLKCTACII